jgi:hypothetical protein
MLTIPFELEQQVIQFAQFEHTDPVEFLRRVVADYSVKRDTQADYDAKIIEDYEDIKAADLAMLEPVTFSESEAWSMIDDVDN